MQILIYGGMFGWFCVGALLGLRGRVGILFLLTIALLALLIGLMLMADAKQGSGSLSTSLVFTVSFIWVPSLWASFMVCAVADWMFVALRDRRTRK